MDITPNQGAGVSPVQPENSATVVFYTRSGCHLCDEAKQQVREIQQRIPFEFREFDIDKDPALQQRYNDEVPVVFIHGKKAFKYRIDAKEFVKRLERGR